MSYRVSIQSYTRADCLFFPDELESAYIKLANSETQIEDLKAQLDDALGAEEMLVPLTERYLMLSEVRKSYSSSSGMLNIDLVQKVEEMRITIEDLEALRELNDELEENNVETERAMQDEISMARSELRPA